MMPGTEFNDSTRHARRPGIAVTGYDQGSSGWDLVEDLSGEPWNPPGARTVPVATDTPEVLAETLVSQLSSRDCRAVLLIGQTRKSDGFRVQMRAENRALDQKGRATRTGPGVARTTAPVADIVQALTKAGLTASATSDAEDDVSSYLLYRVLSELPEGSDTPVVGLLRVPAHADEDMVRQAIKAAMSSMARYI